MSFIPLLAHPEQSLAKHLAGVAELAELFATWFGASGQGKLAGLLHDLGKADGTFQVRMAAIKAGEKDPGDKQPHAHHGAALALAQDHWPVAFVVNGHHAGLHNRGDLAKRSDYVERAKLCLVKLQGEGFNALPKEFGGLLPECLELPTENPQQRMLAVELFTRFLFSALVDADRLDTEQNDPESKAVTQTRQQWRFNGKPLTRNDGSSNPDARPFDAAALLKQVGEFVAAKRSEPSLLTARECDVQRVRDEVAGYCLTGGSHDGDKARGLFSLTVPTGGGKTLASMLFALSHAQSHAQDELCMDVVWKPMRRVIVVIPYLSIIQQTAFELKKVFGDLVWKKDAVNPATGQKSKHPETGEEGAWLENDDPNYRRVVLEHHSNAADPVLDEKKVAQGKASDYSRARTLRQLAAENWDAPIIVTTSVQFFDSLFSRRPADARKLHNIAHSVIIFDEVQTLPPHLLPSILDVLGELTHPERPYGCSAVFCTATPPALGHDADEFSVGLKRIRPIVAREATQKHFDDLKRVDYYGLQEDTDIETLTPDQLAERVTANDLKQCLVVVNTRKSARQVFTAVQQAVRKRDNLPAKQTPDSVFHLSTWMIPGHRLQVLEEVRRRLSEKKPCFLVSTQCIEAGVDVDFPEVWRAYGPYDSIVQAAGRCNREGKLSGKGRVYVFRLEGDDPEGRPGIYGTATAQTTLLRKMGRALPEDPASFGDYFRLLYQISVPDECLIQQNRAELRFEEVSKLFQFIEDQTFPVLVREFVENGDQRKTNSFEIYEGARARSFFTRNDWRGLQCDIITLPRYKQGELLGQKLIEDCFDGERHLFLLVGDGAYQGGVNGFGINFKPDYSERTIL